MITDSANTTQGSGAGDKKARPHIRARIYVVTPSDIDADTLEIEEVGIITIILLNFLCIVVSLNVRLSINITIMLYIIRKFKPITVHYLCTI